MSFLMNRVLIDGRLAADPETRSFQSGGSVTTFRIINSESYRDKDTGEWKDRIRGSFNVAVFNEKAADYAANNLRKGDLAFVEGQLEARSFTDQGGAEKWVTEIVIRFNGSVNKRATAQANRQDGGAQGYDDRGDNRSQPASPRGNGASQNREAAPPPRNNGNGGYQRRDDGRRNAPPPSRANGSGRGNTPQGDNGFHDEIPF